ncbi:hypothetical protein B0H14DRAFT_2644738 [Mycena olivaceomarginata]|nr:hypothetical protein B0H14DRAFT_2644738 [Mycena olivaceomarginata]
MASPLFLPSSTMAHRAPAPAPAVLLCVPIYLPDAGHEDQDAHTGGFYAVVDDKWRGVVSSRATLAQMCNRYPQARTFNASTWSKFLVKWDMDCTEYHNHESESADHNQQLEDARIAMEAAVQRDLAYLARTRPPPVPLSARDARNLFKRVLGPEAVPSLEVQLQAFVIEDDPPPPPTTGGPVIYATQLTILFRDDAISIFKRTACAELLFSPDEGELFRFLHDTAASTASQHTTYVYGRKSNWRSQAFFAASLWDEVKEKIKTNTEDFAIVVHDVIEGFFVDPSPRVIQHEGILKTLAKWEIFERVLEHMCNVYGLNSPGIV